MTDIPYIYSLLLARGYQDRLFAGLKGSRKREGRETLAECPFCGGARFSFSSDKPVYKCWNCDKGGDWITYLQEAEGLDFRDAVHRLASEAGVEIKEADKAKHQEYTKRADLLEAAHTLFVKALDPVGSSLHSENAEDVLQYLLKRGYNAQDIRGMELGAHIGKEALLRELEEQGYTSQEIQASGLLTGGFGETHPLTLLWRDRAGRAIGIVCRLLIDDKEELKQRNLQKYKNSFGMEKDKGLIGFSKARGSAEVAVLEGVLDALYLNYQEESTQSNKPERRYAVSTGGISLSSEQLAMLQDAGTKELYLALDSDKAGQDATEKALRQLTQSRLRAYVVSFPQGYKDPDELVRKERIEAWRECLRQAKGGYSWLARRILEKQDLSTEVGKDRAVEEALEIYSAIYNSIGAAEFREEILSGLWLDLEGWEREALKHRERSSKQKAEQAIQDIAQRLQAKKVEHDIPGAELALIEGLQEISRLRGVAPPEPYLLDSLLSDILATEEGLLTGYRDLDNIIRIPQGALTIVAGRTSHGKTTTLLNLLLNMVRRYPDRQFYFYSYEEAKRAIATKLVMIMAGHVIDPKNFRLNERDYLYYLKQRGQSQHKSIKAIEEALEEYSNLTAEGRLWIMDKHYTAEDLAAVIGSQAGRAGSRTGGVIVDYIQKVSPQRPQNPRYLDIKVASELLLEQAVSLNIPIMLGAQLTRSQQEGSKKVKLENLRESGDIEQDASLVIGLYNASVDKREESGQEDAEREVDLELIILKNRSGGSGGRSVMLTFDRPILRLKDRDTAKLSTKAY